MAPFLPGSRQDPIANFVEEIHSNISRHDPIRELTNGFNFRDDADNIFSDVLENTYGRLGQNRNYWDRGSRIEDDFGIDYSDRFGSNMMPELNRTSRELMSTLYKHVSGINIGRHGNSITQAELSNYLVRVGDNISPQDRADLMMIGRNFDHISTSDGRRGNGITFQDMAWFTRENRRRDQEILAYRERSSLRNNYYDQRQNLNQYDSSDRTTSSQSRNGFDNGNKVITERLGPNNHIRAEGAEMPLSPDAFKEHYGIPKEIDFLKFMPGKANDGKVPNFWTSDAAAGLGGRDDKNGLRWDNPDHHGELSLDFQRNFAQLADYFRRVPIDKQEEFVFNFARTQEPLIRAHGGVLLACDNEKIQIFMNGKTQWIDLVQDVGSPKKLLQWGAE